MVRRSLILEVLLAYLIFALILFVLLVMFGHSSIDERLILKKREEFGMIKEVKDERHDLDMRISNLELFMKSGMYLSLTKLDQDLLADQIIHMYSYSKVLKQRINRFVEHKEHHEATRSK